jgi:hypothetical protein
MGYGATFLYVLSPQTYDLPAALDQSSIQEHSAGSFLLLATYHRQTISNPGPFIPDEKKGEFGVDQDVFNIDTHNIAAGLGYGYNWVPAPFYVAPLLAVTLGTERINYDLTSGGKSRSSVTTNVHLRLSAGINAQRFFLTTSLYYDRYSAPTESLEVGTELYGVAFAIGTRF